MIWFTADHHFGHENIIKYCNRPFKNANHMNEIMVERWNERVKPNDTVYYLGDFTLGNASQFMRYASRLNGQIYFVYGGHDKRWWNIEMDDDLSRTLVRLQERIVYLKQPERIVLCHYPLLSWEGSHYGSLHLHGHCHGTIGITNLSGDIQLPPGEKRGVRVDVGVDCWNFAPVNLGEIRSAIGG